MNDTQQHLQRILAAVDVDAASDAVLSHASAWAQHYGAALTVLHIVADESASDADLQTAARELEPRVAAAVPEAVSHELTVERGRPGPVIQATAASMGADLVVIGTHGRGMVGRWVLGSVAADVLRHCEVPALVVKSRAGYLAGGTLVAAVDFSVASEAAVRYSGQLARESGASLCLLHVLPIGDHESPGHVVMRENATRALEALRDRLVPPAVDTDVHVAMRMEAMATAIAHYARDCEAHLIAMGGHGARWVKGTLGGVTERVLHETDVPVLVVRAGRLEPGQGP